MPTYFKKARFWYDTIKLVDKVSLNFPEFFTEGIKNVKIKSQNRGSSY